jgi:hypothetical protein
MAKLIKIVNERMQIRENSPTFYLRILGRKLKMFFRTKISNITKRPARETLIIDRDKRQKRHHVEEQRENGEWQNVHNECIPFADQKEQDSKKNKLQ